MKTQVEKQELKEVLGRWAGFRWHVRREYVHGYLMHGGSWVEGHWDYKGECSVEGTVFEGLPDFPQSLDACFKWLVPKAIDIIMAEQGCSSDLAYAILFKKWLQELELDMPNAALALCLAIKKLIKEKEEHGSTRFTTSGS